MAAPIPEPLKRLYDIVAGSPNLAADTAFVIALPRLSGPLRHAAIEKLFDRGHVKGLSSLVAGFDGYDEPLRSLILEKVDGLFEATRVCMASDMPEKQRGAVELIRLSSHCRLAYLLSEVLTRRCPKTTEAAATALLSITQAVLDRRTTVSSLDDRRVLRQDAEQLCEALLQALDGWQAHFRTEVLTASMWLCDLTEAALFKKASASRTHLGRAVNEVLLSKPIPLMASYALRALRHSEFRAVAAKEIGSNTDGEFVQRLLDEVWITLDPENAKSCSWIRELSWLSGRSKQLESLTGHRVNSAVRLLALSGIGQEEKLGIYRRMILGESPQWQEAALWQVIEMDSPAAMQLLRRVEGWRVGTLSQIASQELFRRDPKAFRSVTQRVSSSGGELDGSTTADFDEYWDRYDVLDNEQRESDGQRLNTRLPSFSTLIRAKLSGRDVADRLQALRIVRTLGLTSDFEERIYALGHDPDESIRSLAVSMLSEFEGAIAVRILHQAINDPDERVQANAVEVLAALGASGETKSLVSKLAAEDNRIRANAAKALISRQVREAAEVLITMLNDKSSAHRISALWVVQQLGLTTLVPRVEQIARNDADECVRERAKRVLSELPMLSSGVSSGATEQEVGR